MRHLLGFLLFLVFVDESAAAYKRHMFAPMVWVHEYLLEPSPIKLRPFDLVMLIILGVSLSKRTRDGFVAPMRNALWLVVGTTVTWFAYGMLRGGDARYASWQTYLILSMVLFAFTVATTFRTPEHYRALNKWIMTAALYRAVMCWISYFTWGQKLLGESGAFLTIHDDTIPWVVTILILVVESLDRRSVPYTWRSMAIIVLILGAIQFNSRRLAWVSLLMGLVVLYFLLPPSRAKRVIRRSVLIAAPFLAVYVAVGWGHEGAIFLPLHAFASVSTQEDASTLARNAENLGLIATANFSSAFTGAGWGQPYACLTHKYDISAFELWQYMPHNSILGLLAFTGMLGFAGFWLAVPTAVFLNTRVARMTDNRAAAKIASVGAAQMIVCANQLYGDMGIFSPQTMYVLAISYAMAMRLPVVAGVWGRTAAAAEA